MSTHKILKKMGLVARTKAFEDQIIFARYMYVFLLGALFATFFIN